MSMRRLIEGLSDGRGDGDSYRGANFVDADCFDANFDSASMRMANFNNADFTGAILTNAECENMDLRGARNVTTMKLTAGLRIVSDHEPQTDFVKKNLRRAFFTKAKFDFSDFTDADFSKAKNLDKAIMPNGYKLVKE